MSEALVVRIENAEAVDGFLELLGTNAEDLSASMTEIGVFGEDLQRANVLSGKTAEGFTFFRLEPGYQKRKAQKYPGKGILRATDAMLNSISSTPERLRVEIGPTDRKASYPAALEPRDVQPLRDFVSVEEEVFAPHAEQLVLEDLFRGFD